MKSDDILKTGNLRENPFGTPAGYLEHLPERLSGAVAGNLAKPGWADRISPYFAMAALFLILVTAGTFLLKYSVPVDEGDMEAVAYSNIIPVTAPYSIMYSQSYEDEEHITEDDIIDYLIFSGVSLNSIENE